MEKLKTKKQNELKIDRKTIKTMERPTCRDKKKHREIYLRHLHWIKQCGAWVFGEQAPK